MFPPISAIVGLLLFASTLPNGIRLAELPSDGDSAEIVAGYTSGGLSGLARTSAASDLLFDAYAVGARIDFIKELNRSGLRIVAPTWALPVLVSRLPALFMEVPKTDDGVDSTVPLDFRAKIEEEIHSALLGFKSSARSYATEDAFVLISASVPNSLRDSLAAIPKRAWAEKRDGTLTRLPAERTLRFKAEIADGGVIFASPLQGVYYRQWYAMLLLDRLIRRVVPRRLTTSLPLTVDPNYYRVELSVPQGQFPEPAEDNLLQDLQRLQFTPANARDLAAARQDALGYLDSKEVKEWFASYDLQARRQEGMQWIEAMSADDLRVTARDLLLMNRVIATWPPRPRQTSVSAEPLNATLPQAAPPKSVTRTTRSEAQGEHPITPFPAHTDPAMPAAAPERLASGISLVASSTNAVFVSGAVLTRFERDLTADDLKSFQQYPSDRILVLTPAASLDRARQLWSAFKGSASGQAGVPKGKVSSGDLSAIFVLKTILDFKLIQSGWWPEASVGIGASEGSTLLIQAPEDKRAQVVEWIKGIADKPLSDAYFKWIREVAMHRYQTVRADLQALVWERDREGSVPALETVSAGQIQDVARIYF